MFWHTHATPKAPNRVVVLGGGGFIGTATCRALEAEGIKVLIAHSADIDLTQSSAAARLGALLRAEDSLLFLSALSPDRGRGLDALTRNIAMGVQVSAALAQAPCNHVVYVSSDAVYGTGTSTSRVREDSPTDVSDLYGAMHRARELMLASVVPDRLMVLRPTLVYGMGDTHNQYGISRFCRAAVADRKITLFGKAEERRDHVSIQDAASVIKLCLTHRTLGVLNVVTGQSISFVDIASTVAAYCGIDVMVEHQPQRQPVFHRSYDNSQLIKAFPALALTPLRTGIAEMCDALRRQGAPRAGGGRKP